VPLIHALKAWALHVYVFTLNYFTVSPVVKFVNGPVWYGGVAGVGVGSVKLLVNKQIYAKKIF
jgi:hypothetical protein